MNLTIQDTKKLLMPYADGELSPAEVAAVEKALAESPEARAELEEIRRVSSFAREAVHAPAEQVNLDGVYAGVMARIAAEDRHAAPAQQSAWARFTAWLGEVFRFERPMALAGIAAAVVAVVVGAVTLGGGSGTVPGGAGREDIATKTTPGVRRGPEVENKAGRNTAYVEDWQVAKGKVIVDVNKDDPDQPMVLWHVVEDEGTVTPKGL